MEQSNKTYYMFLIGLFIATGSLSLIVEHYLSWGYLEFEPIGHETYGLIGTILGLLLMKQYLTKENERQDGSE